MSQQLLAKEQPLKATGCHWFLQNTFNQLGSRHCHPQAWNPTKSCHKSMWQVQQVWRPGNCLRNVHCSHALQMYTFLPLWHKAIQSSRIAWEIPCWTQANIIRCVLVLATFPTKGFPTNVNAEGMQQLKAFGRTTQSCFVSHSKGIWNLFAICPPGHVRLRFRYPGAKFVKASDYAACVVCRVSCRFVEI